METWALEELYCERKAYLEIMEGFDKDLTPMLLKECCVERLKIIDARIKEEIAAPSIRQQILEKEITIRKLLHKLEKSQEKPFIALVPCGHCFGKQYLHDVVNFCPQCGIKVTVLRLYNTDVGTNDCKKSEGY